ncbi:pilus assembly protein TadG-related protein [Phosphitispora sp. TUW77]|uniref:pilus assembly protein TadG-related protein n=1 Tax=Phosphitispora sp. TUW77 TaxID=3152361 RepID=UPI003AB4A702
MDMFRRLITSQNGNVVIISAIIFTVLLGFVALAVDGGILYLEHTRLVRGADAAALAGAQELPDTVKATARVSEYLQKNSIDITDPDDLVITFSSGNKEITVNVQKPVQLHFAKLLGLDTANVDGTATAKISPVSKIYGLIPLGLDENLLPLAHGHQYIIKVGNPSVGWTGIIAYPGQAGKDDYRESAQYGYDGPVTIGDIEGKAPGNATGPTIDGIQARIDQAAETWDNFSPDSPRIVLVPIYRNLGILPTDGLEVVGFASVFLEKVVGAGLENEVYVRYVNYTVSGETDDSLTGTYLSSVKLIK